MKKRLLCIPLWGILALSLSSCRSEDTIVQQNQNKEASKHFSVFTPKNIGETIDYAKGFAYLMQRYDKLQKTNLSGINNQSVISNLNASTEKNTAVFQNIESHVVFNIRSQTITEENGDKWVVFPKVQGNKVIALVTATLTQNGTYVQYETFGESNEWFKKNVTVFQEALNRFQQKIRPLALNASITPMATGGSNCYWNGVEYVGCEIEGVTVGGGRPGGGGSGGGGGEGPEAGGTCGPHEDCAAPDDLGGSGDYDYWSHNLLLFSKKPAGEKITNIKDYLKCLNLSQGATVALYVAQPIPNNTSTWSGPVTDPNVGHTFISITQGQITRFFGFYPSNSISPFSNPPAAAGMYVNDQGHEFNVSITSTINASQLSNMVGYINSMSSATYNLNSFNCTNFGIDAFSKAGISMPKTSGSWPGGGGANPGNLGQDLRGLNNSSVQKNTSGGNAPKNSGNCN